MQLDAKIWQPFRLLDMFDAVKGDQNNMADLKAGDLPLISAKDNTNGLKGFVTDNGRKFFRGHCLTLNNEGSGTGLAFYQSFDFLLDSHVTALYPKIELSRATLLFIATCIRQQRGRYGFGYSLTNTRLQRLCVMLPVNDNGEPDFDFMAAYMRAIEEKILQRYRDFVNNPPLTANVSLDEKIWRPFLIGDLFRLEAGKCSQANRLKKSADGVPYIGATNRNNGVLDFVEPDEKFISRGNAIAFVCDGEGSMGYSFYKAEDCIATTNIIFGYADFLNRHVGIFITTVADKVRGKYSYNYKRRLLRLKSEQLMLPVNDSGEPDFDYMAAYVKRTEAEQYRRYLDFKFS